MVIIEKLIAGFTCKAGNNDSLTVSNINVHKDVEWQLKCFNDTWGTDARQCFTVWMIELLEWNNKYRTASTYWPNCSCIVFHICTFVHIVWLQLTSCVGSLWIKHKHSHTFTCTIFCVWRVWYKYHWEKGWLHFLAFNSWYWSYLIHPHCWCQLSYGAKMQEIWELELR